MAADKEHKKVSTAKKTKIALEMKKQGFTYQDIADKLGCKRQYAYTLVKKELERLMKEVDESCLEYREIESQRLEDLWNKTYPKAKEGDMSAVNACIRISERKSKLFGLDGVQKVEHSGDVGLTINL